MRALALPQIEKSISQLSLDEQLWLVEQLVRRIRESTSRRGASEGQLAAMAADPEIRNELRKINQEFALVEADGLAGV